MSKKGGFTTISDTMSSFELLNKQHLLALPIYTNTKSVFNSNFGGGKQTTKLKVKKTVKPTVKKTVKVAK